jgi:hypothetical protein
MTAFQGHSGDMREILATLQMIRTSYLPDRLAHLGCLQDLGLKDTPRHNTDYSAFVQMRRITAITFCASGRGCKPAMQPGRDPDSLRSAAVRPHRRETPPMAPCVSTSLAGNDAYFQRLRERVEQAGRHGIYVGVMLFEAWALSGPVAPPTPGPITRCTPTTMLMTSAIIP